MEQWRQEKRGDVVMVDIEALVPKDHLLRVNAEMILQENAEQIM